MNKTIEIMAMVYGKKAKEMITKCSKKVGLELINHEATTEQLILMLNTIVQGKGKSEIRQLAQIEIEKLLNPNTNENQ